MIKPLFTKTVLSLRWIAFCFVASYVNSLFAAGADTSTNQITEVIEQPSSEISITFVTDSNQPEPTYQDLSITRWIQAKTSLDTNLLPLSALLTLRQVISRDEPDIVHLTATQAQQVQAYLDGANQAIAQGLLMNGRVSTSGALRSAASRAAAIERANAAAAGDPYQGQVGHVPVTTWTGTSQPYSWLDLDPTVNSSIGGQANGYPLGCVPTDFQMGE